MQSDKYKLRYLPIFYDDLSEAVSYIADILQNKQAALALVNSVEKAILERLPFAEAFEQYHSVKERKYAYYRIYINNFIVFYVIIKDEGLLPIMEVRRLLYKRSDYKKWM